MVQQGQEAMARAELEEAAKTFQEEARLEMHPKVVETSTGTLPLEVTLQTT